MFKRALFMSIYAYSLVRLGGALTRAAVVEIANEAYDEINVKTLNGKATLKPTSVKHNFWK